MHEHEYQPIFPKHASSYVVVTKLEKYAELVGVSIEATVLDNRHITVNFPFAKASFALNKYGTGWFMCLTRGLGLGEVVHPDIPATHPDQSLGLSIGELFVRV